MSTEGELVTHTQAAEPTLDATAPAPSEDETQSIYAWSQYGSDDTEQIRRRSWKLPVALASIAAAAAVTTGVVMLWPEQTSTPPAQTQQVATSPDILFIDTLNSGLKNEPGFRGAQQGDPDAIFTGHQVCEKLSNLYPIYGPAARGQIIQWLTTEGGAPSKTIATTVEGAAEHAYCPQYAN